MNQKIKSSLSILAFIIGAGSWYGYTKYQENEKAKADAIAKAAEAKLKHDTPHWEYIAESKEDWYQAYLPAKESTYYGEPIKTVWIKRSTTGKDQYTKTNYSISCKENTLSFDQIATYDSKGNQLSSYAYQPEWVRGIPGNINNAIIREVCNY